MKGNVEEIAGKLRQAGLPPKLSSDEIRLFIQTWRRLAEGRAISPHEVEQMAMSLQIAPAVASSTLSKLSERDSEGNFVGFSGLSLKTHPHRLRVNGHGLST